MKTLEQEWDNYLHMVYPTACPSYQTHELRKAFYAGFIISITCMQTMLAESNDDEAKAAKLLEARFNEGIKWMESLS